MLAKISRGFWNAIWKLWYPFLTRLSKDSPVTFLNYGYADIGSEKTFLTLKDQDESNRPCIQLYHRVASAVDLRGLDVLEVSCGHGGGAAYVANYLAPRSFRAVDRNAGAIEFCKKHHHHSALEFSRGNALALPFPGNTFDAVINVEASHCYPDVPRFFSEVQRVLRPGGHFLYADFRQAGDQRALLQRQLEAGGLQILSCHDISANVVRGMQLNTEKYEELVRQLMPRLLRKPAMNFAGVKGSQIYRALEAGECVYFCYHLRKPSTLDHS